MNILFNMFGKNKFVIVLVNLEVTIWYSELNNYQIFDYIELKSLPFQVTSTLSKSIARLFLLRDSEQYNWK
jgi:hypothetical protein